MKTFLKIALICLLVTLTTVCSTSVISIKSNNNISIGNVFIKIVDVIMKLLSGGMLNVKYCN